MNRLIGYFPRVFLAVNGLIYCVLVGLFLLDSQAMFSALGVELKSPLGYTELNTTYIGLMSAMGVFSLLGVAIAELRPGAILIAMLSYFALSAVRSWGVWGDGVYDSTSLTLLSVEVISLVLAVIAWVCLNRTAEA